MAITTADYGNLTPTFVPSIPANPNESHTLVMPRGCAEAFTSSNLAAVEALVRSQARRRKDDKAGLQVHTYCALIPPASLGPRVTVATSGLAPILFVVTSDALSPHLGRMLDSEPTGRVVYDPLLGSEYCLGWTASVYNLSRHPELAGLSEHELASLQELELMVPEEPLGQYLKGKRGGLRRYMAVTICTPSTFALGGFWCGQELLESVRCAQSLREDYSRVFLPDELADPFRYWQPEEPCSSPEKEEPTPANHLVPGPDICLMDPPRRRYDGWSIEHNGSEQDSGFKLVTTGVFV